MFLLLLFMAGMAVAGAGGRAQRYVCPPCGNPCDANSYDKPGTCPVCGMSLVTEDDAKAASAKSEPKKKIAILIFDDVEIIDYTGPYEVFGAAGFEVYTVGRTKDPVTTAMGMTVTPKYSFVDAPQPDVLVVPGGGVNATENDPGTLKWITGETAGAQHTMSVCNGAFILAKAGLLDGLSATTTSGNIARLRTQFPKIKVVDDQRYVDNGKIITAAGLSAGIDGALHVIALLKGVGFAEEVALVEEYNWSPRSAFARAALADRLIPDVDLGAEYGKWDIVSTEGSTDHWEQLYRGTSNKSASEIMNRLVELYSAAGTWTRESTGADGSTRWRVTGKDGKAWRGTVAIKENPGQRDQYTASVKIAKGR